MLEISKLSTIRRTPKRNAMHKSILSPFSLLVFFHVPRRFLSHSWPLEFVLFFGFSLFPFYCVLFSLFDGIFFLAVTAQLYYTKFEIVESTFSYYQDAESRPYGWVPCECRWEMLYVFHVTLNVCANMDWGSVRFERIAPNSDGASPVKLHGDSCNLHFVYSKKRKSQICGIAVFSRWTDARAHLSSCHLVSSPLTIRNGCLTPCNVIFLAFSSYLDRRKLLLRKFNPISIFAFILLSSNWNLIWNEVLIPVPIKSWYKSDVSLGTHYTDRDGIPESDKQTAEAIER